MSPPMAEARDYELMVLVSPGVTREGWDGFRRQIGETFARHEAEVVKEVRWADQRRLSYPVRRNRKGTYHLMHLRAAPGRIAAMRRDLRLHEEVLRELILEREGGPKYIDAPREDAGGDSEPE